MKQKIKPYIIGFLIMVLSSASAVVTILILRKANLGAFTTIQSSDQVSTFPTTYNANLNKTVEIGTTSVGSITSLANLATVGTITSGVWNGTHLQPQYGGTGSTSLTANMLLVGNGTNPVKSTIDFGTSGQVLTSGGVGVLPTWTSTSFDTSVDRTITGDWLWDTTSSSTWTSNFSTFKRLALGLGQIDMIGIRYAYPSVASTTLIASGTVFQLSPVNAAGTQWGVALANQDMQRVKETVVDTATSSIIVDDIPPRMDLLIRFDIKGASSGISPILRFNNDDRANYGYSVIWNDFTSGGFLATTTFSSAAGSIELDDNQGGTGQPQMINLNIVNSAVSAKMGTWSNSKSNTGANAPNNLQGSFIWNNTSNYITKLILYTNNSAVTWNSGSRITVYASAN